MAELLALPLGLGTIAFVLIAMLRLWDAGARRVRLRLVTALLMFALLVVDLAIMDPIEHRMVAAAERDAALFAAGGCASASGNGCACC